MAKTKKTVYTCDRCYKEYASETSADNCYESHLETKQFLKLLKRYRELRKKIQVLCPHRNKRYGHSHETMSIVGMLGIHITKTKVTCTDCNTRWIEKDY